MSAVSIISASHCRGDAVAAGIASRLGCEVVDTGALVRLASRKHGFSAEKLERICRGTTTFLDSMAHGQERGTAYLRSALADLLREEHLVLHGPAGLVLPRRLTHVLRVGLAANFVYRLEQARDAGLGEREARERLREDDAGITAWANRFRNLPPWDESLHDMIIPMQDTETERAVDLVMEHVGRPALVRTADVEQAIGDFALAAEVNVFLAEKGHDVDVSAEKGRLTLTINKYVLRLKRLEKELVELAGSREGVLGVETRLGHNFMKDQPKIFPRLDIDMPSRVLLVDDEKEFVHTLSERLETRHLDTAVAYDGEQALEMLKTDPPAVMVLDLKMPGLDGLEVLRQVKKLHPEVEVIILSGHGSDAEQNLAMELGAFAYLQKPADIDVLASTMKEANRKAQERSGDQPDSQP